VFAYEWLVTSRRWQMYAMRSTLVALLGIGLTFVWWHEVPGYAPTIRSLSSAGQFFFNALVSIQLVIMLLIAPAATAGAMAGEKARAELLQLLTTDLSSAEIILGKLGARMIPVLGLLGCSLPVLSAAVLLGGVSPDALLGACAVLLGLAVVGCSLALLLSLWAAAAHEVLLAIYFLWGFVLLLPLMFSMGQRYAGFPGFPSWLDNIDPFRMTFLSYFSPGTPFLEDQTTYLVGCLALSAVLVLFAVVSVRRVVIRRSSAPVSRQTARWLNWSSILPGPSLDRHPVLWRERRRRRPSQWMGYVWLAYILLALLFSGLAVVERMGTTRRIFLPLFVNAIQVAAGLLLVSVAASAGLAEDRGQGGLETLLVTPLSTWSIVWGKWWGAFRSVPALLVLPVLVASSCAYRSGCWGPVFLLGFMILAFGAALASLGVALATRLPRPAWALTWCVGLYVCITVGSIPLTFMFYRGRDEVIGSGSPLMSAAILTSCCEGYGFNSGELWYALAWNLAWFVAYALVAAALLCWTLVIFNRRLGRMEERSKRRAR